MFNKEEIERLEGRIEYLEKGYNDLKKDLVDKRISSREELCSPFLPYVIQGISAISLEDLQDMQNRILDYLNVELKTTGAKTELVTSGIQPGKVCVGKEDLIVEEEKLDKRENCKVCPKCGSKEIQKMWDCEKNTLEKYCECSYGWQEDCLDK